MDIIKEIWNGKVAPCAIRFGNEEINKKYTSDIEKTEAAFTGSLTDEQKLQYEILNDRLMSYQSYIESVIFAYGVRLGAKIAMALTEDDR